MIFDQLKDFCQKISDQQHWHLELWLLIYALFINVIYGLRLGRKPAASSCSEIKSHLIAFGCSKITDQIDQTDQRSNITRDHGIDQGSWGVFVLLWVYGDFVVLQCFSSLCCRWCFQKMEKQTKTRNSTHWSATAAGKWTTGGIRGGGGSAIPHPINVFLRRRSAADHLWGPVPRTQPPPNFMWPDHDHTMPINFWSPDSCSLIYPCSSITGQLNDHPKIW